MHNIRLFFAGVALSLVAPIACAHSLVSQFEILRLLSYITHSDCEFYQYGKWQSAAEARTQLDEEYRILSRRELAQTAEEFIHLAASRDESGGEPHKVKCRDKEPIPTARWLKEELQRLRSIDQNQK